MPGCSSSTGRLDLALGKTAEGIAAFRSAVEGSSYLDVVQLAEIAERLEAAGADLALAVEVRGKLRDAEPQNLANLQALQELARRSDDPALGMATCNLAPRRVPGQPRCAPLPRRVSARRRHPRRCVRDVRAHPGGAPNATAELRKAVEAARANSRARS